MTVSEWVSKTRNKIKESVRSSKRKSSLQLVNFVDLRVQGRVERNQILILLD